jgi:multicomponent Na+:H+ antiporter subunit B
MSTPRSPQPHPPQPPPLREAQIIKVVSRGLFPPILLFAFYVQFHGDFGPGGGFQAGVIFASGWTLYGLIYGLDELQRAVPPRILEVGIAAGVLLYGGVGLAALFLDASFLNYSVLDSHSASHGQHRGIFWVELGVGITVASVMLTILYAFAGRRRLQ